MGFNLDVFFVDLEFVLNSDVSDKDKVKALVAHVAEEKKYAEECGMINQQEGK